MKKAIREAITRTEPAPKKLSEVKVLLQATTNLNIRLDRLEERVKRIEGSRRTLDEWCDGCRNPIAECSCGRTL